MGMRKYWTFYWPLAVTGLAMLLGAQFKNGILASYADGKTELASFAIAAGTFGFMHACIIFVPHMSNVLARSRTSHRVCYRFTLTIGMVLSVPLLFLVFSAHGNELLARVYNLNGSARASVLAYLRMLTPLILVDALRNYYMGLLVQAKRTRTVTALNVAALVVTIAILFYGRRSGWSAVITLSGATIVAAGFHLVCVFMACACSQGPGASTPDQRDVQLAEVFHFYWPTATTSVMFALSRPIMYGFINRLPEGLAAVAALRVAFDFAMLFHNPCNQFRHFFATYGGEDLAGTRRFMKTVVLGLTAAMVITVFSPLARWILLALMRIPDDVVSRVMPVLMVLCLTPVVITTRNYYHGRLMVCRRTLGMAVGAVCRVLLIAIFSFGLYRLGRLNHVYCAAMLIAGFAVEALVSALFVRAGQARCE